MTTNHAMNSHGTVKPHLPLLVMVGRCSRSPDMRDKDGVGRQARGFPHLTNKTKNSAKIKYFRWV